MVKKEKILVDLEDLHEILHHLEDTMYDCNGRLLEEEDRKVSKSFKLICKQVKKHCKEKRL